MPLYNIFFYLLFQPERELAQLATDFYASATKHLGIGLLVGWLVGWSVGRSRHKFQKSYHTHARRRETSYDVARLLLMVPLELWRNSTPIFGAAAFCTTKIDDFRASLTPTFSSTLSAY